MQAAQVKGYEVNTVLYMAMELSNSKWKLGFGNGAKLRRKSIDAPGYRTKYRFTPIVGKLVRWAGSYVKIPLAKLR